MPNATDIIFTAVFTVETLVITIGNTLTIFVLFVCFFFFTQRFHLKETYFLLINLVVADLLVGVTESKVLGSEKIPNLITEAKRKEGSGANTKRTFQVLGFTTSVFFLALIALERVFSVLWPLRHRVTSMHAYVYTIVIVWSASFSMAAILTLLPTYHPELPRVSAVTVHSCLFISLLVISASYFTIRNHLSTKTK